MEASFPEYVLAFVLGLVFGSFANVLIYRIPRDIGIFSPSRSFCPNCKRFIPFYLNVPVFSWIFLRGRCRWCGWRIPIRYPLVELSSALLFCLALWKTRFFGIDFAIHAFFLWGLLVMTCTDIEGMVIPSAVALAGALIFFAVKVFVYQHDLFYVLLGTFFSAVLLFIIAVFYRIVRRREGIGFGDIEFMLFVGAFGGIWAGVFSLVIGSFLGAFWSFLLILRGKSFLQPIPFVPFLSAGAFIWYIFQSEFVRYLVF